jgi:hypothetical protein
MSILAPGLRVGKRERILNPKHEILSNIKAPNTTSHGMSNGKAQMPKTHVVAGVIPASGDGSDLGRHKTHPCNSGIRVLFVILILEFGIYLLFGF